MRIYILDCIRMVDKESTHKYISSMLNFPDYYGNNLDALSDCLEEFHYDSEIHILNSKYLHSNLEEYGDTLLDIFEECCTNLTVL